MVFLPTGAGAPILGTAAAQSGLQELLQGTTRSRVAAIGCTQPRTFYGYVQ